MTDFHHSALDAHPDDSSCRLLLAEWLAERGDPDAAGYRWMAERAKRPFQSENLQFDEVWDWWFFHSPRRRIDPDDIPPNLLPLMTGGVIGRNGDCNWVEFPTRREAEAALCRAVSEMQKEAGT